MCYNSSHYGRTRSYIWLIKTPIANAHTPATATATAKPAWTTTAKTAPEQAAAKIQERKNENN